MYRGVTYMLYTYDLHHIFGRSPTVEKFNPQLIFHNSNIGLFIKFGTVIWDQKSKNEFVF